MKVYVVVDWHARILSLSEDDAPALAKFKELVLSAEDYQTIVFQEMDLTSCECKMLMSHRNSEIVAYDDSLTGIAADLSDERHALNDCED